ncbi:MAG TPA: discoidin domain-containing protein [Sedimentisphaerales bacterium]|nr:discoidin domain-containing protein [Sedimentisphaerales bacterium]HRS11108.1 discoidin domain-containing protein [Sedimentisphaerales bacterium]HRV47683.1 discoidin domain-containing protein [Sedimentisphaerales bacterium]
MTSDDKSRMRQFTFTLTAVIALSTTVAFGGECIIFSEELAPGADLALRGDSQFVVSDSDPYRGANHLKRDFATWGSWAWITGIRNLNLDLSGIDFDTAYIEFYIDSGTVPIGYLELRLAGAGWDPDFQTTSVTVDDQPGYQLVQVMLKDFIGIGTSSGVRPANLDEFTGGTGRIDRVSWGFEAAGDLLIDEVRILDAAGGVTSLATHPVPAHGAADVPRDVTLGWTPGQFANTHDVYLGTAFEDVNGASRQSPRGVLVSQDQEGATFESAALLEFGATYYWRIDEVNAAPDYAIFKGDVWNFTVEPFAYPIVNVIATSNGASDEVSTPQRTVDGSGINADDQASVKAADMWLAYPPAEGTLYIQYEFDSLYKLHEMLVWNYNVQFEPMLGFGLKNVTVEYSENGTDWTALGDFEFARATATTTYTANTTVSFGGVAARYVRLNVNSGYGSLGQYGLSEVRFMYIPAHARQPQPADGATDVEIGTALAWRSGRNAASHEVHLGTDPAGLTLAGTVNSPTFAPDGIEFGSTYYWQVVEVNEADAVTAWPGDVWTFSTQEYALVDGFETYNDDIDAKTTIFDTWIDGWVNGTGSTVGYLDAPFAERTIVHSGRQSMPLAYDNSTSPFYSEAEFDLGGTDLMTGGAVSLRLFFHGDAANIPETLYVAIEDSAGKVGIAAHPDPDAALADSWQEWVIPYSELTSGGVNLSRAATMYIGLGDRNNPTAGGTGRIFIDDVGFGTARPRI